MTVAGGDTTWGVIRRRERERERGRGSSEEGKKKVLLTKIGREVCEEGGGLCVHLVHRGEKKEKWATELVGSKRERE